MDASLLRQVEWLWEHIIEAGKEKTALENQIENQNLQIELLNKRLSQLEKIIKEK